MTVEVSRRSVLIGGMAVLATALPVPAMALRLHALDSNSDKLNEGEKSMATITTKDGTQIFYKDWGPKDAQPIVFHHGWPLSSDDWDTQMLFSLPTVIALSRMTGAVTVAPRRWALATTWTITRPTHRLWPSISPRRMRSSSDIPGAAARWHAMLRSTASPSGA